MLPIVYDVGVPMVYDVPIVDDVPNVDDVETARLKRTIDRATVENDYDGKACISRHRCTLRTQRNVLRGQSMHVETKVIEKPSRFG